MIKNGLYSLNSKALDGVSGGASAVLVLRDGKISANLVDLGLGTIFIPITQNEWRRIMAISDWLPDFYAYEMIVLKQSLL